MVAKPGGDGWDLNINYDGLASLPKLSVNLQMIRSFKDKGLRGHLGGKIKQELGLSKLGTIRYRTASGSDRPVVSSEFFNNERAGRYRSRFCNDKLLLARTTQSHFELQPQRLAHTCLCG